VVDDAPAAARELRGALGAGDVVLLHGAEHVGLQAIPSLLAS
jgi:hypothetical protein